MKIGALSTLFCWFLTLCLLVSASGLSAADRVALVIGNGSYTHVPALPNPRNDAVAITAKLTEMGFAVETAVDSNLADMRAAIQKFGDRAVGAEKALIFYAGHGIQVAGTNYLLPTDTRLSSSADLATAALSVNELFDQLNRARPETAIMILDACRDNPFASSLGVSQGLASGNASAFTQRPNASGVLIAFASAPGSVALDGVNGNSPYTTALLQWIDRPGIELATMFRRVRTTVLDLTNGTQVPWVEEALTRDVFLTPPAPAAPAAERIEVALLDRIRNDSANEKRAAETFLDRYLVQTAAGGTQRASGVATQTAADDAFVREGLIWLSIRNSQETSIFEAYLQEFPNGNFAALAQQKLEDLNNAPPPTVLAWLDKQEQANAADAASPTLAAAIVDPNRPLRPNAPSAGNAEAPPQVPEALPLTPSAVEQGFGFSSQELAAIQLLMRQAGAYRGALDADYGPGTRGAIRQMQAAAGLAQTGFLDQETLQHIVGRAAGAILKSGEETSRYGDIHRIAAVAARGAGAEPRVIRVEAINRNKDVHQLWQDVARDFEADRPGTLIQINHRPGVRYRVELMSILGSETPPDILYTWGGGHLDALREAGFARDLTEEMAEGWAFEFKPGALQNYTSDGRIHGVPMHLAKVSLYANRTVLARAGIDPSQLNTWEGFLSAVQTLKAQGITPLAVGGGDRWPFHLYFGSLAQRLGGKEAFDNAIAGFGDGFASPPFLQAGAEFARLAQLRPFQPGYMDMDDGQAVELVAKGEAAMVLTGNWRLRKMFWTWPGGQNAMQRELAQIEFPRIGNLPQGAVTHGGADGFAVSTSAPEIAVDFLRRLTAINVQERMAELAADVPALSGADLGLADPFLGVASDSLLRSVYHQLYVDQVLGPNAGQVLTDMMVKVATGQISGEAAVREVAAAWDDVLAGRALRPAAE